MAFAHQSPPLSPVLLAGMAAAPLPPAAFQPLVGRAFRAAWRRHPEIFERLEALGDRSLLIEPLDLPFCFLLRANERPPVLDVRRAGQVEERDVAATIRGPLLRLLELAEGRADGDALFFSRDIAVAGETEVVVALRNALDGAELDILEVLCLACGPLAPLARRLARPGMMALAGAAARHLAQLQAAIAAPTARRCDAQDAALATLEARVAEIERRVARRAPLRGREAAPGGGGR